MGDKTLQLFPFQLEGVRFALQREGTLLADEMGCGKSIEAIGVINADFSICTILIVCPSVMKLPWKRELENWLVRSFTIGIVGINAQALACDIIICNYERLHTVQSALLSKVFDLALLDECHYCKNPLAKRTRLATSIQARRRMALSGTPLLNYPVELLPVLTWLDPTQWPKSQWFNFMERYAEPVWNGFGWKYCRGHNLEELSERLRSTVMIRRTKQEVLPELPPKLRSIIEIEPESDDVARLVSSELEAFRRFEEAAHTDRYTGSVKTLKSAAMQEWENLSQAGHQTALAKVPYVTRFVVETFNAGVSKLVLWVHHRDVAFQYKESLSKYRPVLLLGGMTSNERQQAIDTFQSDPEVQLFVGGISCAGIGITLTASSHCIFAELSWVPASLTQAEDRCHRLTQRSSVLVQHLVLSGSLDAVMARTLLSKQRMLDLVLTQPERVNI
jgi:SWI/SNF-related matrix-associated actin-dependent regulator 1 of chromatin subfamily A